MKALFILLVFLSFIFVVKSTNKELSVENKTKNDVNLIFTKMYKHKFTSF